MIKEPIITELNNDIVCLDYENGWLYLEKDDGSGSGIDLSYQELAKIPQVAALIDAARELSDLVEDIRTGNYTPDSFTLQPMESALEPFKKYNLDDMEN